MNTGTSKEGKMNQLTAQAGRKEWGSTAFLSKEKSSFLF
jgi:hypothetical protein